MCECKADIEEKLTKHYAEKEKKGRGHEVTLKGYAIVLGAAVSQRPYMPYETFAYVPLVKGGEKPKKTTGNMFFSFCPFCGEKVMP
jgi:hypothetical protein